MFHVKKNNYSMAFVVVFSSLDHMLEFLMDEMWILSQDSPYKHFSTCSNHVLFHLLLRVGLFQENYIIKNVTIQIHFY